MRGSNGTGRSIAVLIAALACTSALAEVTVQDPGTFVVDQANVIDDHVQQQLEALLTELQEKTAAQVKILTVPTVDGEDFFGWVQRHAELWKLGQPGKDNGVLIALALNERKIRIHVGYGLEGLLPDSWCGTLRREATKEHLSKNQYGQGLSKMAVTIADRIATDANVQLTGLPSMGRYRISSSRKQQSVGFCASVFPLFVMILIFSSASRRQRHYGRWGGGGLMRGMFWGAILGNMMGGGRSSWGGGSSGFGGGGFGGGGGGFFGGGGGFGGGGSGGSF